jgi:serine/threonine protein kinase
MLFTPDSALMGEVPILDLEAFHAAVGNTYALIREIGRGGMATVYLADDRKHDRRVAIKILNAEASGPSAAERFQREIKVLARLQHPNILPVFDSGVADGRLWYAMPFVEGESLRSLLDREGKLDPGAAASMLAALAAALGYAHDSGIIHRDIKPENILLSHSIPLIADFGIAAALDPSPGARLTETGMAIGTLNYMSPEQATAEKEIDGRSDIFSLGCVGFEMIAGRPPFEGPDLRTVIARMIATTPPSLRSLRPEVPETIASAVERAIASHPERRWQTGAQFAAALTSGRVSRGGARRNLTGAAAAMMLLVATIVAASFVTKRDSAKSPDSNSARRPDSAALSAYRRGTARIQQRTQRTLIEGLALIDEALRRDSTLALAWAGRANAFNWARMWEFDIPGVPRDSLLPLALAASEKALDLDSLDANIWVVNAAVSAAVDPTRKDVPINAVRRAIALDPLNARAWIQLGTVQEELDQMDSSLASFRRGMILGNRAVGTAGYANHLYWRREFDSAAVWSDSAIKYSPRQPYAWEVAGASAIMRKRYDEAQSYYEAALRLDQGPTRVRSLEGLAELAAIRGDTAKALALIADAEKLTDPASPSDHAAIAIASAYAAAGKRENALQWLERYQPRSSLHFQLHVRYDAQLDPLRKDRRFAAILTPVRSR